MKEARSIPWKRWKRWNWRNTSHRFHHFHRFHGIGSRYQNIFLQSVKISDSYKKGFPAHIPKKLGEIERWIITRKSGNGEIGRIGSGKTCIDHFNVGLLTWDHLNVETLSWDHFNVGPLTRDHFLVKKASNHRRYDIFQRNRRVISKAFFEIFLR